MVIGDGFMTNSSDSDSQLGNIPTNDINQKIGDNQGLVVAQASSSIVIGTISNNYYHAPDISNKAETVPLVLGENPYKGLEAFEQEDRDRFFGRDDEIKGENGLLKRFQSLRDDQDAVRILPVYGASGSGKSSLVKAGLVPLLRDGLKDGDRILLMKPSGDPIRELAKVLVHELIDSQCPVKEIDNFKAWLLEQNEVLVNDGKKDKDFDGLHRIIDSTKGVKSLILVIDQFEEIYTYGTPKDQRDAFINNLLCATDAAKYFSRKVSVILTMRSDFLGKTHECPKLNVLFAAPSGFYVPIMQKEQLAIAISEPAKRSGHTFTEETIDLLLEQSRGQEGALPLLQFALTQIWEGLLQEPRALPINTLRKIGGVGGALASKTQEAYDLLRTDQEKQIARSIFLKLIFLNDDNRKTRRRASILDLLIEDYKEQSVREVVAHFAQSKVRILVTSAAIDNPNLEIVEIAHEALIDNWEELQDWLRENEQVIVHRDEIERLRKKWESQNRSKDYLLEGRNLRDALEFQKSVRDSKIREVDITVLTTEFIAASQKKKRSVSIKRLATIFIFPTLILTPLIFHFGTLFIANQIIYKKGCNRVSSAKFFLQYLIDYGGITELSNINLCGEYLSGINLNKIKLITKSNFSNLDLSNSKLEVTTLRDVNMQNLVLRSTSLRETTLINVDLSNASLLGTNLKQTVFKKAVLQNTSFDIAILKNSVFIESDLSEALDLTSQQLSQSKICRSKLPQTININHDCSSIEVKRWLE